LASYTLLAADGSGAAELERNVVMKGADWSPFYVEGRTQFLSHSAADEQRAEAMPKDWLGLYHTVGLKSFLAVPIGTAAQTVGVLTIAKEEANAFADAWWVHHTERLCCCRGTQVHAETPFLARAAKFCKPLCCSWLVQFSERS
jgi:hypothetical protein